MKLSYWVSIKKTRQLHHCLLQIRSLIISLLGILNPFQILNPRSMEKVVLVVVKAMKNPRSALCKTSIMASSDIFKVFGDQLLDSTNNAFDNLLLQLLLKASQDKRFVCEEADRALNAMVKSMTPLPFLNKLRPYVSHSNPRVRAKAAITISNCLQDGRTCIKLFLLC
ncbi:CLASP [Salix koriyanagi]|uniref:CLASP n=1 Tax=Salix koriyanagi TaxID=2511006 RepID=A0A9Q0VCH9_9ROSI|nr:CLASP [Salix koriyanagi]